MINEDKKDLLEKWQILGLSFIMMSKTPEDFHDLVKQEFGYIWDGKGWIKEVSYHWLKRWLGSLRVMLGLCKGLILDWTIPDSGGKPCPLTSVYCVVNKHNGLKCCLTSLQIKHDQAYRNDTCHLWRFFDEFCWCFNACAWKRYRLSNSVLSFNQFDNHCSDCDLHSP